MTVLMVVIVVALVTMTAALRGQARLTSVGLLELVQGLEAGINDVIFVGAAIFFLASLESRIKRARVLAAVHELRALAHIIDMHQLTKDPSALCSRAPTRPPRPSARSAASSSGATSTTAASYSPCWARSPRCTRSTPTTPWR